MDLKGNMEMRVGRLRKTLQELVRLDPNCSTNQLLYHLEPLIIPLTRIRTILMAEIPAESIQDRVTIEDIIALMPNCPNGAIELCGECGFEISSQGTKMKTFMGTTLTFEFQRIY